MSETPEQQTPDLGAARQEEDGSILSTRAPEPTQVTSGATQETAEDSFLAPGQDAHEAPDATPINELARLEAFLHRTFPSEMALTNRQQPEGTVDTAIRLLTGLHAHKPPTEVARCTEQYCNQPEGHLAEHGWVHYG